MDFIEQLENLIHKKQAIYDKNKPIIEKLESQEHPKPTTKEIEILTDTLQAIEEIDALTKTKMNLLQKLTEYIDFYKDTFFSMYQNSIEVYKSSLTYCYIFNDPMFDFNLYTYSQTLIENNQNLWQIETFLIYLYGKYNERFKQILNFILEIFVYQRKIEPQKEISIEQLKNVFDTKKDYYNHYIFYISFATLNEIYLFLYNTINTYEIKEIDFYDLQTYTEQFYKLLDTLFSDSSQTKTETKAIADISQQIETTMISNYNIEQLTNYQSTAKWDRKHNTTEKFIENIFKRTKNTNQKELATGTIKTNEIMTDPNFKGTAKDAKNILDNISIFDFYTDEELKAEGITRLTYKKDKDNKENYKLQVKIDNFENIVNIEDKDAYLKYGSISTIQLKNFIEAYIFSRFHNSKINETDDKTIIRLDPYIFNEWRGMNNKNITETQKEIDDTLHRLRTKDIVYYYGTDTKGDVWYTKPTTIDKNELLTDETKEEIKKSLANFEEFREAHISIVYKYTKPIKVKNKYEFHFTLSQDYINYLKLVYINGQFITDKTPQIKTKKGNQLLTKRAEFLKNRWLQRQKIDSHNRTQIKADNYEKIPITTSIAKLKNDFVKANLLNINEKRLKKYGYFKIILDPIFETLELLKNNGNIEYNNKTITDFKKDTKRKKDIVKNYYENEDIFITFYNKT